MVLACLSCMNRVAQILGGVLSSRFGRSHVSHHAPCTIHPGDPRLLHFGCASKVENDKVHREVRHIGGEGAVPRMRERSCRVVVVGPKPMENCGPVGGSSFRPLNRRKTDGTDYRFHLFSLETRNPFGTHLWVPEMQWQCVPQVFHACPFPSPFSCA